MHRFIQLVRRSALALGLLATAAHAATPEVTVAYQQIAGPMVAAIASGAIEKATGYKIHWRQFDSGAKVATAMASGDVQVGVIGSSPLTAAVSRGVDLQLVWILDDINEAEAMVARNGSGIAKPSDLRGKKLAVPFVSTTHFHALFALKLWGINPGELQILNMQPNQIAAAWERGDIDAAYVWDPALAHIKQTGKVLVTSGELSKKGKATFDGIAADRTWASSHADFMVHFIKVIADADAAYRANPVAWGPASPQAKAIAAKIGGQPQEIADAMKLYAYPSAEQQASPTWLGPNGGAVKALQSTALFLREQKSIDTVAPDYGRFVTAQYVQGALALKSK